MRGIVLDAEYLGTKADADARRAKVNAWIDAMRTFQVAHGGPEGKSEIAQAREDYIAGAITFEAFEARLDVAFGISL